MAIPLLFTLPPSTRHELILIETSPDGGDKSGGKKPSLKALNAQIVKAMDGSPNCEEFMSKHKSKDAKSSIRGLKMHWSVQGREKRIWPEYTVVTEKNWAAILEVLKQGGGGVSRGDVLEVDIGADEDDDEGEKGQGSAKKQ